MLLILNYKRNMIYILQFQVKEHYLCICFKFRYNRFILLTKMNRYPGWINLYKAYRIVFYNCLLSEKILLAVFNQYPLNFYSLYNYHLLSYKLHWPYNLPTIIARKKNIFCELKSFYFRFQMAVVYLENYGNVRGEWIIFRSVTLVDNHKVEGYK